MYNQVRKRRVRIEFWSKSKHEADTKKKQEFDNRQAGVVPGNEYKFEHHRGCGWDERYGWFAGYGAQIYESNEGVTNYKNDNMGIELVDLSSVFFIG